MLHTEMETIRGRQFRHNWSDEFTIIRNDGVEYVEAYDVSEAEWTYTESDKQKPKEA